eukprot:TRINITY_DN1999_c0_g1_i1.p2 TRINITY_DN1999_c0_g1~~TRINITY_DN1999_c0_g1_i1.p2  ORF type:complete len:164 (+),score=41.54 TRINITY_DN1999_c0_g1_i1:115-606(+)
MPRRPLLLGRDDVACCVMEFLSVADLMTVRGVARRARDAVDAVGVTDVKVQRLFAEAVRECLPGIRAECRQFTPQTLACVFEAGHRYEVVEWLHLTSPALIEAALRQTVEWASESAADEAQVRLFGHFYAAVALRRPHTTHHLLMLSKERTLETSFILFRASA